MILLNLYDGGVKWSNNRLIALFHRYCVTHIEGVSVGARSQLQKGAGRA